MFETRHLRTFLEVVNTGSYSNAARELGYTQPGVSQHIKALEREVGTPLFVRTGRTMRLTEAGRILAADAGGIMAALNSTADRLTALSALRGGRVRIATFPSAAATLVPLTVSRLAHRHPGIRVSLVEAEPPEALALLRAGGADVAVTFAYGADAREEPEGLVRHRLLGDSMRVLMPVTHRLADRTRVSISTLAQERWIAGCEVCRQQFVDVCAAAGFEPDIVCATDDNLAVQSLVAAGAGIALMPGLVVSFVRHPGLVTALPSPGVRRDVFMTTLDESRRIPAVATVMSALRTVSTGLAKRRSATAVADDVTLLV